MKHFHMMMAVITIAFFLYQSYLLLTSSKRLGKKGKIATHVIYTLLIISGVLLVMPLLALPVPLQWVGAKIILLIAAVSASIKAFKTSTPPTQQKMGIVIAAVAYVGIVVLAITKPGNLF